jgi:hypothetical protein
MYGEAEFTVSNARVTVDAPVTVGDGDGVEDALYLN